MVYVQLAKDQASAQALGCDAKTFWEHMAPIVRDSGSYVGEYTRDEYVLGRSQVFLNQLRIKHTYTRV